MSRLSFKVLADALGGHRQILPAYTHRDLLWSVKTPYVGSEPEGVLHWC
jgi:hypothetical protein